MMLKFLRHAGIHFGRNTSTARRSSVRRELGNQLPFCDFCKKLEQELLLFGDVTKLRQNRILD
jgi:hypothetical protein